MEEERVSESEEINDSTEHTDTEENSSFIGYELEALKSIYLNEIDVRKDDTNSTSVSIDLHPATADNLDEQYVRLTLKLILKQGYPSVTPDINIRNPRGLSDENLSSITQDLLSIAESKKGHSMLFEMIEAAKEHLTAVNRPSGECAICLYGFDDSDVFTRTECYHYFHSHCLARYSRNAQENINESKDDDQESSNELLCPMCRVPVKFEGSEEDFPPPVAFEIDDYSVSDEIIALQEKMADLYQKQVEKGGIIDIEAEKNKYLLEISNVPTRVHAADKSTSVTINSGDDAIDSKNEEDDSASSQPTPRRQHAVGQKKNYKFNNSGTNKYREGKRYDNYTSKYNRPFNEHYRRNNTNRSNRQHETHANHSFQNGNNKTEEADNISDHPLVKSEKDVEEHSLEDKDQQDILSDSNETGDNSVVEASTRRKTSNYSGNKHYNDRGRNYGSNNWYNNGRGRGNYNAHNSDYFSNSRGSNSRGYGRPNFRERQNYQARRRYPNPEKNYQFAENDPNQDAHEAADRHPYTQYYMQEHSGNYHMKRGRGGYDFKNRREGSQRQSHHYQAHHRYPNIEKNNYSAENGSSQNLHENSNNHDSADCSVSQEKTGNFHLKKGRDEHDYGSRKDGFKADYSYNKSNEYDESDKPIKGPNKSVEDGGTYSERKYSRGRNSFSYEDKGAQSRQKSNYSREGNSHSGRKSHAAVEENSQDYTEKKDSYYVPKSQRDYGRNSSYFGSKDNYEGKQRSGYKRDKYSKRNESESFQHEKHSSRNNSCSNNHVGRETDDCNPQHNARGSLENLKAGCESETYLDSYQTHKMPQKESVLPFKEHSDQEPAATNESTKKELNVPANILKTETSTMSSSTCLEQSSLKVLRPPPGFANPSKKVIYGLQAANAPPGFHRS